MISPSSSLQIFQKMLNINYIENEPVSSLHESSFKLPLQYLDKKYVHDLSPTVLQDLELVKTQSSNSCPIYDIMLKPQHPSLVEMGTC